MSTQTLADLWHKGYRPKNFTALRRRVEGMPKGFANTDPVGVVLFEKRGEFYQSIVYERFDGWIYATPEKLVRDERTSAEVGT